MKLDRAVDKFEFEGGVEDAKMAALYKREGSRTEDM